VVALVPARNEEESLPGLLAALAREAPDVGVLVVDNGSEDATAEVARRGGARVVREPEPGYGRACRRGLDALAGRSPPPEVVVFVDADDLRAPAQIRRLAEPVRAGDVEMVRGRRRSGDAAGVHLHAALGNAAVSFLLRGLYAAPVRDMGPFRAVRFAALRALELDDPAYGWYVQMDLRALRAGWRVDELPVAFRRRRTGRSKISGSLRGSLRAARGLLAALGRELVRPPGGRPEPPARRGPGPG
jgi:glycosyltransferase involved in cell wall biosynthesis